MKTILSLAAVALTLSACSGGKTDNPPADTNVEELAPTPPPVVAEPTPEPSPSPTPSPTETLPPEAAAAPDEQMLDDASATGMTARANRDQEQPADAAEQR
ncbi:hypothetical protein M0208_07165 [Sphingomonas sp. SUN019]|uniref:hypothetical protein n=1 Tax=Sphingomonas sp. SUN019 TaxID=2937788 RepID=UPI002164BD22|nr:hypothetical protein [Sphingomonas sp. SUN019]UVO50310.1 hypothetical protein M0208_07165 [Sphingomonas sp. SUN019]